MLDWLKSGKGSDETIQSFIREVGAALCRSIMYHIDAQWIDETDAVELMGTVFGAANGTEYGECRQRQVGDDAKALKGKYM